MCHRQKLTSLDILPLVISSGADDSQSESSGGVERPFVLVRSLTMRREYQFYVYIMHSISRHVLYIGMTNNLHKRVWQHKMHGLEGFTDRYNAVRLVFWEKYDDVRNAIDREKQLKRWRREKKIWLIEQMNPRWKDLAADWYETANSVSRSA